MTKLWQNAAEQYELAASIKRTAAIREQNRIEKEKQDEATQQAEQSWQIEEAIRALNDFMRDRGLLAQRLLAASGRHIIFGEDRDGSYGSVYYIDGEGLCCSHEAMGMWTVYSNTVAKPVITRISTRQAVEAAVHYGDKKPNEIIGWLCKELDAIAVKAVS